MSHITTSDQPSLHMGFGHYTCNWGAHVCGLYETDQERDDIVYGFVSRGIEDGDLQACCPAERTPESFLRGLSQEHPGCAAHLDDENVLRLYSTRDLYYPDGVFSPETMMTNLDKVFEDTQRLGPRNIRATAEMVWALEAIPGREHLMAYESRLNYFIPGKPWISICMYNVTKFRGDVIMSVLRTHPFTISKGVITQNPFYQDPDHWLRENAPEFLPPGRPS